jgi:hypothetical protein
MDLHGAGRRGVGHAAWPRCRERENEEKGGRYNNLMLITFNAD